MQNVQASTAQLPAGWQFPFSAKIVIALAAIVAVTLAVAALSPEPVDEVPLSGEYVWPAP